MSVRPTAGGAKVMEQAGRPSRKPAGIASGTVFATLFLVALTAALTLRGYEFYLLDLEARRDHPDFRILSPTGWLGQAYGVGGAVLIFANLSYLIRRRLARQPLGSMRGWLDMHVVTGLTGAVLIVFHSAFQLRSGVAMAAAGSVCLVTVTGAIGRYFHALAPRVDRREVAASFKYMDAVIPGLGERLEKELAALPKVSSPRPGAGLLRTLAMLPIWMLEARRRRVLVVKTVKPMLRQLDRRHRRALRAGVREVVYLQKAKVVSTGAMHLLRVWRGMHRLFALVMLSAAALHIGVAWYYGYRWIWSE